MSKYEDWKSGEWERVKKKGFKLMCCSCSLVHVLDFKVEKCGRELHVYVRVRRDDQATAAARRGKVKTIVVTD